MWNKDSFCQRAYAKINLTLDVGDIRPDGFHKVTMVMQTVALWDEITLRKRDDGKIHLDCNLPYLARDEKNIAWKAARLFLDRCDLHEGVNIRLYKKIPVAAGLAGGSSDAAAVLRGMNRLFDTKLPLRDLMKMGEELGSDIPYCLLGGTCLATGRGEIVERIEAMPEAYIVLVKPDFSISTPWSYANFDPDKVERRPDIEAMRQAIRRRDLEGIGDQMVNLLERAALEKYPVLSDIKDDLRAQGATGVLMSGSGPTVYALFQTTEQAKRAADFCRDKYPASYQIFDCALFQPKKYSPRV